MMLFSGYDSKHNKNTMSDIIVIMESNIMFYSGLEWSMKWKLWTEQVPQAFGPLLLLHPLPESREATPQGYDVKWHCLNHFLKGREAKPSEYTPKTPKIVRNFEHSNLCHFPECFSPKLSPLAAGCLGTLKIPVPAWPHLWVLWTYLHGVQGFGWVNVICLWSEGYFTLTVRHWHRSAQSTLDLACIQISTTVQSTGHFLIPLIWNTSKNRMWEANTMLLDVRLIKS